MASIKRYKTAKGTAWRVQYRSPDGRSRTKQGFRTKDEATVWADKNAVAVRDGEWVDPTLATTRIRALHPAWWARQQQLKPSTRALHSDVWERYIKPTWGDMPVGAVKKSDVQAWVTSLDVSPSWARTCHMVLAQLLDVAVDDQMMKRNPARGVKLPRKPRQPVDVFLTWEQLNALANASKHPEIILLLGTVGLRWGELAALRPRDLDPLRNRIHITRSASKADGKPVIVTPKTHEVRTAATSPELMRMLVEVAAGVGRDELLWRSRSGGPMLSPGHRTWFASAVERCMKADSTFPRVTPHGLRHVAAGLMIQAGANPKLVQRQLGHSSAAMTLDIYAGLWEDGLDAVMSVMGASNVVGSSCDRAN